MGFHKLRIVQSRSVGLLHRGAQALGIVALFNIQPWLSLELPAQAQQVAERGEAQDPPEPPTPDPKDPLRCQLYELRFEHVVSPSHKGERAWFDQTRAQDLSCMTDLYRSLAQYTASHDPKTITATTNATRILWVELLKRVGSTPGADSDAVYEANKQYIDCTGKWQSPRGDRHNAHMMIGGGQRGGDKGRKTPGCQKGKLFLNNRCEMQAISSVKANVGDCYMTLKAEVASPISLVWSEDYKNEPSTIVSFKLNPHSKSEKWMWRASESLPLVVHDPANKGAITSATQLFGNWTAGGKQNNPPSPWRDGYEALATFDKNSDGAVSGEELAEISLWFDKNRDGVSQEGEVKRASSVGVTHLYLKADRNVDGAPFATKGYTRTVNGSAQEGSSFDWLEREASSADSIALRGLDDAAIDSKTNLSEAQERPEASKVGVNHDSASRKVLGSWVLESSKDKNSGGLLIFESDEEGIAGVALKPSGLRDVEGVAAEVVFSHFVAKTDVTRSGRLEVSFVVDGTSGASLRNVATLSDDGNTLEGKTVVTRSAEAKSGSYEYTWRARRM